MLCLSIFNVSVGWPFSSLWGLVPLALLFVYGLSKANYEAFCEVEQKIRRIEAEKSALQEKLTTAEKRRALKDLLGEAHEDGESLYQAYDEDNVAVWVTRTRDLIEAALDKSEAQLFLSNRGDLPFTPVDDARTMYVYMQEQALGNRLIRLEELTNRLDSLNIRPDFDPHAYRHSSTTHLR
jgi:hypothetical protein